MRWSWEPLAPTFGADIFGLDIGQPIDVDDARRLADLWDERGLLRFRGQALDAPGYLALSRVFGELEVHPSRESHAEGFPQLLDMRYDPAHRERTAIYEVDGEELANWQPWHIDMIYTTKMDRGGLLQAKTVPPHGGLTGFIDRVALLDDMPPALRRRIEGRRMMYQITPCFDTVRFLPWRARLLNKPAMLSRLEARRDIDMPIVSHPAILRHPVTGVENLAISPVHAIGFEDMGEAESDALLEEVIAYILAAPGKFFQEWRADDIVLWDNWRFVHMAGGCPTAHARHLYRAGVRGDYVEGRVSARNTGGAEAWASAAVSLVTEER
jgi:taurine dioxygenase